MPQPISIAQTFIALLFVIGLIFLFTYVYKKFNGQSNLSKIKKNTCIRMITTFPLGNKKFLAIVKIQEQFLMLGITQDSISLITDLNLKEEELDDNNEAFENVFTRILQRIKK
jgi:flagellar protein FliO/FliZ